MQHKIAAGLDARITLCGRLSLLAAAAETMPPPVLAGRIEELRRIAIAEGLTAAARVARAFTGALSESRCRNSFTHWFAALADAIDCEDTDADMVADACLAAVMVRMG
ncbi:hypothetical protein [Sphingomonas quercus]|uniref:Uncharacterized protein n=1 Tax=Sphingomonas quercus TaxID=2842451 RepID=A0ABS6BHD5_9SPHN|nr:hypothetical protein [Sphingomonas quercus]MBU3077217.1 hypothetical protein [Sphingomonas quercus]